MIYIQTIGLAKARHLINADMELVHINISDKEVDALVAFPVALNKGYD